MIDEENSVEKPRRGMLDKFETGSESGPIEDRAEREQRISELLTRLDLASHRHSMPPELSGGERQRVAVARALVNEPQVILADEPTGSLDDEAAARVVELLREHCGQGGTVVAVSHDARLTRAADRIIRVADGVAVELDREQTLGVA